MMDEATVIVVEDDPELRRLLGQGIREAGFRVEPARNGREAMMLAESVTPDALVIDIGLPDTDGRDLCRALKGAGVSAPVLFLTARDAGADRVSGFSAGGDDYLTKPFLFAELVARLKVLVRRASNAHPSESFGGLRLDPMSHTLISDSKEIDLTPTEFRLVAALIARPEEVVRRRELIGAGWPEGAVVHDNTVDVYVGRLRKKLKQTESALTIKTVHGVGYRLQ